MEANIKILALKKAHFFFFFLIIRLNRKHLVSTESHSDDMVSYGVRNSIAAYLSFSGSNASSQMRAASRKNKSKSVYALPDHGADNTDYEDF